MRTGSLFEHINCTPDGWQLRQRGAHNGKQLGLGSAAFTGAALQGDVMFPQKR